jgi:uncharacterized protein YukE
MSGAFGDTINPLGRLKPPGDYHELETEAVVEALPKLAGPINEATTLILREVTGWDFDVLAWLSSTISGNWSNLLSLRDVYNNLSYASDDISTNLTRGLTELNPHWDGNAAQAFDAHMEKWYGALEQNRAACAAVRDHLATLAEVAKEFLQAVIDMVELIITVVGGGVIATVLRAAGVAEGVIAAYKAFRVTVKAVQAVASLFEAIAAKTDDEAPETRVDVPDEPYGGPTAPGTM